MNDIVNPKAFPHLTPLQSRAAALAANPRRVAVAAIVCLAVLGWVATGVLSAGLPDAWAALCQPLPRMSWSAADTAPILGMWTAMTLAMMLPAASPMILTYAEIADTAGRVGERVISPFILIAGYVAVWLGFALMATTAQIFVGGSMLLQSGDIPTALAGGLILAAGAYQFSSLKHACLHRCQRPFPFFFANWTDKGWGVFKLGWRQGLYCLGCCWVLMLVMFAVGAMNVVWMAALGALMTIEKMTTTGRFARALGACLMAAGAIVAASGLV